MLLKNPKHFYSVIKGSWHTSTASAKRCCIVTGIPLLLQAHFYFVASCSSLTFVHIEVRLSLCRTLSIYAHKESSVCRALSR